MIVTAQQYSKMSQKTKWPISGEILRKRIRNGEIILSLIPGSARMGIDINKYPFSGQYKKKPGRPKK